MTAVQNANKASHAVTLKRFGHQVCSQKGTLGRYIYIYSSCQDDLKPENIRNKSGAVDLKCAHKCTQNYRLIDSMF